MKLLVLGIFGLMMNSAFAYTYQCKSADESKTMVVKNKPDHTEVVLGELVLKGKYTGYVQVSNRSDKYIYTLTDNDQNQAELAIVFMTRGGRFGVIPGKALAANTNTSLTYLGETNFYACYTNYQD